MRAWTLSLPAVLVLLASPACHTRSVPASDGTVDLQTDAQPSDAPRAPDAGPHSCKRLVALGATPLGPKTEYNARPAVVHDGTHFGVAWLHGKAFTFGTPAATMTLRFTRVDSAGKAPGEGVKVGLATSDVVPALVSGSGEYAVLYKAPSPATPAVTVLQRLRPDGTAKQKALVVAGETQSLALARTGSGYAALAVEKGKPSQTLVFVGVDAKGVWTRRTVHTGGSYWFPWLRQYANGYAAAWDTAFARLSKGGATLKVTPVTGGISPMYSESGGGHAVAYIRSHGTPPVDNLELRLLDAEGKQVGKPRVVGGNAAYGAVIARYVSLVWTGGMHVAVYARWTKTSKSPLVAQLLDGKGVPVGGPVVVPLCTSNPAYMDLAAAWGKDTLAVATNGFTSTGARLCLSRIRCLP